MAFWTIWSATCCLIRDRHLNFPGYSPHLAKSTISFVRKLQSIRMMFMTYLWSISGCFLLFGLGLFGRHASADDLNERVLPTNSTMEAMTEIISQNTSADMIHSSNLTREDTEETKLSIDYVGYISLPVVMVIGLFGNTMTMIIVRRKKFRQMTLSMVLLALAISDTTLIVMFPFNKKFVMEAFGIDARALSLTGCKLFFWFFKTSKMTSSWFIVLISLERFVAVWFPLKANQINSRRHVLVAILAVYLGIGGYNAVWDYHVNVIRNGVCFPNVANNGDFVMGRIFVTIGTILYSILPSFLVACLNITTVCKVIADRRARAELTEGAGTHGSTKKKGDQTVRITAMLVGVSTAFIVLVVPIGVLHSFAIYNALDAFTTNHPAVKIFREIAQVLEQLNYSINFYLYVFCSATFRAELFGILCCKGLERGSTFKRVATRRSTSNNKCQSKSFGTTDTVASEDRVETDTNYESHKETNEVFHVCDNAIYP